eukprot:TRINITY_DN3403_c0_g1_i1.p1 TRINITY_DN3403_c0_g1~~TRINITY_DN3403_c0_g1_i1.p1  ORF type:complete len:550 (-),score=27.48 TRINITY_DN3403_c0_g1_i1:31-1680(-)
MKTFQYLLSRILIFSLLFLLANASTSVILRADSKMESTKTQLPYSYKDVAFCNDHYEILVGEQVECKVLCVANLNSPDARKLISRIREEYTIGWRLERTEFNAATKIGHGDSDGTEKSAIIYNHLDIAFTANEMKVVPRSIRHDDLNAISCEESAPQFIQVLNDDEAPQPIVWTYRVHWNFHPDETWPAQLSSVATQLSSVATIPQVGELDEDSAIMLLLATQVGFIAVAATIFFWLRREIRRDNAKPSFEDDEGVSWKLISKDVYRRPNHPKWLALFVATGHQAVSVMTALLMSSLRRQDPRIRVVNMLVAYVIGSAFGGYHFVKIQRTFLIAPTSALRSVLTISLFPTLLLVFSFSIGNLDLWRTFLGYGLLQAVLSIPFSFIGVFIAFRKDASFFEPPIMPFAIPRIIPQQRWYFNDFFSVAHAAVMAYMLMDAEVILLRSLPTNYGPRVAFLYSSYIITCAGASVVSCYLRLKREDYRWQWPAFWVPATMTLFMAGTRALAGFDTGNLVNYTALTILTFFLSGTLGYGACDRFVRYLYPHVPSPI